MHEHVSVFFQDELARVLVTLFDSRHLLYQLLWNMFSKEVELADSMQTLFRGNSLASKIMTFCFKVGKPPPHLSPPQIHMLRPSAQSRGLNLKGTPRLQNDLPEEMKLAHSPSSFDPFLQTSL